MTTSLSTRYRQRIIWRIICLVIMGFTLLAALLVDISHGPSSVGILDVINGLLWPEQLSAAERVIIWDVRLPYALMAAVVGASLGLAGAEMQTVLNNPLASPFTLGIGSAATLGASMVIVFDLGSLGISYTYLLPGAAFIGALLASSAILLLARWLGASVHTLLLFGIALMFGLSALVGLVQFVADQGALQQVVFWTMGSLSRASMEKLALVVLVLMLCLAWSSRQVWTLTALRAGEQQALSLGIDVQRLRRSVLLRVSLLTATALAFVGEIGFIGLVGPHLARLLLGEDHRLLLPGSAIAGALLLSLASLASKSLLPGVILPVGIVTSLVGIPLFIGLIIHRRRELEG